MEKVLAHADCGSCHMRGKNVVDGERSRNVHETCGKGEDQRDCSLQGISAQGLIGVGSWRQSKPRNSRLGWMAECANVSTISRNQEEAVCKRLRCSRSSSSSSDCTRGRSRSR